MRKKMKLLTFLFVVLGFAATAQETTSEIQGKVTGTTVLSGATVTAVHVPTGTKYVTTTRKDGQYNISNARVGGPYTVTVSYVGYKEEKQEDVYLTLGTAYKADFALTTNAASLTEVVVTGRRSDKVFSKSRTGAAEIINRQQIERLPTTNRSLQDFTRLTPAASGNNSFGGRNGSFNNVTVNGASFNNTFGLQNTLGGQTSSQPFSIDALEQIQVNLAPYDVTLGGFTGAGINSVTKSGTNEFKGSVYYFYKNPDLTGRNVGSTKIPRQEFNYKNRGATIGGPIIKNKLFFFVSGEQERISAPVTALVASRNGSTGANVSQASGEALDKLSAFLIQKFNYNPGAYEKYTFDTYSDKISARIDWNINSKNTFNINYYYLKSYKNQPASNSGAPGGNRQPGNVTLPFISSSYIINNNFNIVIAELNTRLSNKLSNKLQAGYNALRDFRSSPGGIFPLVDIENGAGSTFTSFGYEPFTAYNKLNTNTYQFNDIVTLHNGAHTFIFGTQNTYNEFLNGFAPTYYGNYRFPSVDAFYDAVNNGATTATRYELRYSARKNGEFPFASLKTLQFGFFAQDKWNVSKDFTLTLGVRADIPTFKQNFIANTNADALVFRDGVKIQTGKAPSTQILWSPRVGFNYDLNGDKSVQLRGGAGIFAGAPPFVWISNQASNNGVDFGSFVRTSGIVFSPDVTEYIPENAAANTAYNLAVTEKGFKFPQVFRANLALDFKLPGDIIATAEGTYNKDINAVYLQNINLPSTGTPLLGYDNRIRYSSTKIWSGAGGATDANPNISDAILMRNTNKGYSYSATFQLQRNVKNLYTMVAYTYGQSKSVNDGGSIAQSMWRDRPVAGDPNENVLANSSFYQPHRVVASAAYRFEYAKHFATSVGVTFEGAQTVPVSATYVPLNYVYSGDVNNDGLTTNDLIYVPASKDEIILEKAGATDTRTADQLWSQLDAYIAQDPYLKHRRGKYAERNALLQPFYSRADLNFTQDFYVTVKGKRNTIRFTMDILNFSNLINKYWGLYKIPNRTNLLNFLRVETTGVNAGKPVFSFPYLDATNKIPLTSTFTNSTGNLPNSILPASRYQIQLGVRYIFN